jgi:hypothetical protein
MSSRVGKRRRRVTEAEVELVLERSALREQLQLLVGDARAAATPGRIVGGGFAMGALVGLLTGRRRHDPSAQATPRPGMLQSLTRVVRLVSLAMPMIAPLIAMAQGTAPGQTAPASAPPDPTAAAEDPLA